MTYCFDYHYTGATLAAIIQHVARSLTELFIGYRRGSLNEHAFSHFDRLKGLVAVSKHSSLRDVKLAMTGSVPEEMLNGLLLDEKVTWPSSLVKASVISRSNYYEFKKKKSRHWSKQRL
eukprot:scaffold654_cov207-Ochromonas_danica.AAC.2